MFGSHLSVAGGLINSLNDADPLGLDTVQVFTKNQRQWKVPALKPEDKRAWLDGLRSRGWEKRTVSHATYLMNCASPDGELRAKSADMLAEELERCAELSIPFLVAHPGAHLGSGVEAGAVAIAKAAAPVFKRKAGGEVTLCLENTAGSGSTLGRTFEELALIKRLIEEESHGDAAGRVGFCVDTCHALAAGYDLAATASGEAGGTKRSKAEGEAAAHGVIREFDRVCGLKHLRVVHLNDSKGPRGSRVDRHTHIGLGQVGLGAFAAFVKHPVISQLPMILETPKEDTEDGKPWDSVNLAVLKRLVKG